MTLFENIQVNCASHVLETAAAWAAMTRRFELGAEILGSAERLRAETGDKPRPWERAVSVERLPRIAASLPFATFDAARRRGAARSFREALRFAACELRDPQRRVETGRLDRQEECRDRGDHHEESGGNPEQSESHIHLRKRSE